MDVEGGGLLRDLVYEMVEAVELGGGEVGVFVGRGEVGANAGQADPGGGAEAFEGLGELRGEESAATHASIECEVCLDGRGGSEAIKMGDFF